jgi:hypothetical protein
MRKTSQYYNPSAPENVMLQPGAGGEGSATGESLSPQQLNDLLKKVIKDPYSEQVLIELTSALEKSKSPEIKQKIQQVIDGLKFEGNGKAKTRNLDTGEVHETGPARAKSLMEYLKPMLNEKNQTPITAQVKKNDTKKDDDKSRGNPFKVLLGQIGKLKDHGASDSEVKKFLVKDGIFDKALIEKALKIYKDLKKDKSKNGDEDKAPKKNKKAFNLATYRMSLAQKEVQTIYDVDQEFVKKSTSDLIARLGWLQSLNSMTTSTQQGEGRSASSKEGVSEEIGKIKNALRSRGFEDSEL